MTATTAETIAPPLPAVDQAAPPAKVRDPFLDNARFWVMLLVVVGHFMTSLQAIDQVRGFYAWVFTFHMPVFVLISGFTARNYTGTPDQVKRMFGTIVAPYLVLNLAFNVLDRVWFDQPLTFDVLKPNWLTWFLAALFLWRLTSPVWRALRWPVAIAVALSLAAGLADVENVLALKRVLGLLPFFVAGLCLRKEHFDWLSQVWVRIASVVALAATFIWCQVHHQEWIVSWLYWNDSYAEQPLDADPLAGLVNRAGLLLLGFGLCAAVLSLIPRGRRWYSSFGERTLFAYMLHGFGVLALVHFGFFDAMLAGGVMGAVGIALAAAVLAVLLMSKPVARLARPVLTPRLAFLTR